MAKIYYPKATRKRCKMIKSPLRYPGGKSRALKKIMAHVPDFKEYREPFLGGGSLFLHLKQLFPDRKFCVNDLYYDVYNFWRQAQINLDAVVDMVMKWRFQFQDGKELYVFLKSNSGCFNDIERAAAFFIFNRITFSGTTHSGGYSEDAFRNRFTDSSIERLCSLVEVIGDPKITITNYDYTELLRREGDNVFIYLDPPYYSATNSALYGKKGDLHKTFDHKRFAEAVEDCAHKYLITYDDCDYIRNLFSYTTIIPWKLTYGMRNVSQKSTQKGDEVFVTNYFSEADVISDIRMNDHNDDTTTDIA